MKKALLIFFKIFYRTLGVLLLVFIFFFASLFFRELKLPSFIVEWATKSISTNEFVIGCESVSFGFRHGFRAVGLCIYDRSKPDCLERPVAKARQVHVDCVGRTVKVYGAEYARLPDSYYEVGPAVEAGPPSPIEFEIPSFPEFSLFLESPSILGLKPDEVCAKVRMSPKEKKIQLDDISIKLPGLDRNTVLRGNLELDLIAQKITSKLSGTATQSQIRPFLVVMDIPSALPYVDAFTEIPVPVRSSVEVSVDLITADLTLLMHYSPEMGKYNSVPMAYADGGVYFQNRNLDDGSMPVAVKVDLASAVDNKGRKLSGWLTVDDFSGRYKVCYDVLSSLQLKDALKIADFMDPSILDFIKLDKAPTVTVKGTSATCPEDLEFNNLSGTFTADSGSVEGISFKDLSGEFLLKEDVFTVDARMNGKTSGEFVMRNKIYFDKFLTDNPRFSFKGDYTNGSLEELGNVLDFDLGEKRGNIDLSFDLTGTISTNAWCGVTGKGKVKITEGHLARMKLFAGLTELVAERIPGVSFLVDQTQASGDFEVKNGVFYSDNVYIEGNLVSIKGWGKYDFINDNLDFTVRVQFLKKNSFVGKIVQPVTWPFTKLLLEFKLKGPIDSPDWQYIDILERIF